MPRLDVKHLDVLPSVLERIPRRLAEQIMKRQQSITRLRRRPSLPDSGTKVRRLQLDMKPKHRHHHTPTLKRHTHPPATRRQIARPRQFQNRQPDSLQLGLFLMR